MERATLYDLDRMCKSYNGCINCPFEPENTPPADCRIFIFKNIDKANEIIINWCKEHPIKTRQDKFLEMFPNAQKLNTGILSICPKIVDETLDINCCARPCLGCYKDYWLAEVEK